MEIELISCRVGELSPKKLELVHRTRPKILSYLFERPTQELKTILEGEDLAEGEGQVLIHSLTDVAQTVVVDVLEVYGDEMGVVFAEVMEKDWKLQGPVVAQIARSVSGTRETSSQVVMITYFFFVYNILTILPWIEFEWPMTESTIHCAIEFHRLRCDILSRLSSLL